MGVYQKAWQKLLAGIEKKTGWGKLELKQLMLEWLLNPDTEVKDK